ncbi:MAG: hypothetical protein QG670_1733, partial [Thermoproteota archaeon]|nr:hypothetical protein [Thermoproteota archaeon]
MNPKLLISGVFPHKYKRMIDMNDANMLPVKEPSEVTEEEVIEHIEEEEAPLNLSQEKRRVYSDKNDRSIFELYRRYQRGDLNLDPEFQRNYVWDDKRASLLVESVLLEIPIPVIYLAEEDDGKFTIIDGQQRLRSFFRFINNDFKLRKLRVLSDFDGKTFKTLDKDSQIKVEDATLRTIEIRKETHPDVKFEIFERLNVGSVKLNDQELRNCIYRGKYNNLIKELSENRDFLLLLGLDEAQKRMQQRDIVLHFLAFYNQTFSKYRQPMKQFLNNEMENNKDINDEKLNLLRQKFKDSISLTKTIFGKNAFRRFVLGNKENPNGKWEKRVNMGLFEVVMCGFSKYKKNQIIPLSDVIREELIHIMGSNQSFTNSISGTGTTNVDKVTNRFKIWDEALQEIIGIPKTEDRLFSQEFKKKLFDQNPTCKICGNAILLLEDATVDHIDQYWRGGKTIEDNA